MDLASLLVFTIKASIVLTVLGLGLNATWQDAASLFRNPSLLIRSFLSMNVIMPLLAAALVVWFDLPPSMEIALLALAVSPVPPILPKKELKAGGYTSYAIGLLVAIAILSIVVVPVSTALFARAFERAGGIAPFAVAKIVLTSILLPLALGIVFRRWLPDVAERIGRPIVLLGTVLLILSALPILYGAWPAIHALFGNGTVLIVAVVAVAGLAIGHLLGGPRPEDRTVLALSTASRHPAIALAVAVGAGAQTKEELAAILLYLIVAGIVSVPYVAWRKKQAAAIHATVPPGSRNSA